MGDDSKRERGASADAEREIRDVTTGGGLLSDAGGAAGLTDATTGELPEGDAREEAAGGTSPLRGTDTGLDGGEERR